MSFNPLPSCEGRLHKALGGILPAGASIHFPLAREDDKNLKGMEDELCFNPLPSCEGRRRLMDYRAENEKLQSTSLLRGKTSLVRCLFDFSDASIHFPLAREDARPQPRFRTDDASIHFPLAREDIANIYIAGDWSMLQSTSLLRGKTNYTD